MEAHAHKEEAQALANTAKGMSSVLIEAKPVIATALPEAEGTELVCQLRAKLSGMGAGHHEALRPPGC